MSAVVIAGGAAVVGVAVVLGWLLPALAMQALLPALESSGRTARNFRGREVVAGLGAVWVVWSITIAMGSTLVRLTSVVWWTVASPSAPDVLFGLPLAAVLSLPPVLLVVGSFAFGAIDDVYGTHEAKGFRGHVGEMLAGRLTTGGLKLLGIGTLALAVALPDQRIPNSRAQAALLLVEWLVSAGTIALAANFVNLLDLRPGRALKVYSAVALPAAVVGGYSVAQVSGVFEVPGGFGTAQLVSAAVAAAVLALGPVLAVWRSDLGERAMLGDGGANAMGAFMGFLLVRAVPMPGLIVVFGMLLGANIAAERVSFSRLIDANRVLRWLDGLGRAPGDSRD